MYQALAVWCLKLSPDVLNGIYIQLHSMMSNITEHVLE